MSICKECIHNEICESPFRRLAVQTYKKCDYFIADDIDRKTCVKLPAYVGQKVWIPFTYLDGRVEIEEGKVSGLQQKADGSWKIRCSRRGSVSDYTVEEFNKYVFLTEEAAIESIKKEDILDEKSI